MTTLTVAKGGEDPIEIVGIHLGSPEVLKGAFNPDDSIGWDAYLLDEGGTRKASLVVDGVQVPQVGDRVLFYLRAADVKGSDEWTGPAPDYVIFALDGVWWIERGALQSGLERDTLAAKELRGKPLEVVKKSIRVEELSAP